MAWALALVAVIGAGLPVAAWLITRRLPPPRAVSRLGAGYDAIDKWLLDQYRLAPNDRWRVRKVVFQGAQVSQAALTPAARGLATQVLTGGFWVLRLSRLLGWVDLLLAVGLAATGIVMLITSHHAEGLVLGVLGIISSGLFLFAGMARAVLAPRQLRRNAGQALRLNQDGT
jgi:hypothetical protein